MPCCQHNKGVAESREHMGRGHCYLVQFSVQNSIFSVLSFQCCLCMYLLCYNWRPDVSFRSRQAMADKPDVSLFPSTSRHDMARGRTPNGGCTVVLSQFLSPTLPRSTLTRLHQQPRSNFNSGTPRLTTSVTQQWFPRFSQSHAVSLSLSDRTSAASQSLNPPCNQVICFTVLQTAPLASTSLISAQKRAFYILHWHAELKNQPDLGLQAVNGTPVVP